MAGQEHRALGPVPAMHSVTLSACFESFLSSRFGVMLIGLLCPGLLEWLISFVLSKQRPPPQKEDSHICIRKSHDVKRERVDAVFHSLALDQHNSVCLCCFPSCPKKALGPTYAALLPAKAGWAKAALGRYSSYGEHQEVDSLLGKAGGSEAGGWTAC